MSEVKRWVWETFHDCWEDEGRAVDVNKTRYVLASDYDALAARVARYEKALNYYANEKLYKGGFDNDGGGHFDQHGYDIIDDGGETARHALTPGDGP